VRAALEAQPFESRMAAASLVDDGKLDYDLTPFEFDEQGRPFLTARIGGQTFLRLTVDRLMPHLPFQPLDPIDMKGSK
jgi:hypothetical protein